MSLDKIKDPSLIIIFMLFFGMFFPTSFHGVTLSYLIVFYLLVCMLLYTILIFKVGKIKIHFLFVMILMEITIFIATLIGGTTEKITFGLGFDYILIGLMFTIDFKYLNFKYSLDKPFCIFNILNIIIGFGIIAHNLIIDNFIYNYYNQFLTNLVPLMLMANKPVLTFSTHSIAGFYIHLFFYLCFKTYLTKGKILYLFFSVFYIAFLYSLSSTTGYTFMFLSLAILIYGLFKNKKYRLLLFMLISSIVIYVFNLFEIRTLINELFINLQIKLSSGTSGIGGRYSGDGVLNGMVNYIKDNPLRPIGMGNVSNLWTTDSGLVVTLLRGSIPLFLLIYLGLFFYLNSQVKSKKVFLYLYATIMFFEIGYPNLIYQRTFFLLPFVIVYLNQLVNQEKQITYKRSTGIHVGKYVITK